MTKASRTLCRTALACRATGTDTAPAITLTAMTAIMVIMAIMVITGTTGIAADATDMAARTTSIVRATVKATTTWRAASRRLLALRDPAP